MTAGNEKIHFRATGVLLSRMIFYCSACKEYASRENVDGILLFSAAQVRWMKDS
jgi:hypothetical protein